MPSIELKLNVPIPDRQAFALEFSKFCATTLGKPEVYISVNASYCPDLTFNGSFDPAFIMTITSLGNINDEANEKYSKAFFGFINNKFGVKDNRGYITFIDPGLANLGHKSTTFKTLFA